MEVKKMIASKGVVCINGQDINVFNVAMSDTKPVRIDPELPSFSMEVTMSLKINRWNRFKMWWFIYKQRFNKTRDYEVSMKWEK